MRKPTQKQISQSPAVDVHELRQLLWRKNRTIRLLRREIESVRDACAVHEAEEQALFAELSSIKAAVEEGSPRAGQVPFYPLKDLLAGNGRFLN